MAQSVDVTPEELSAQPSAAAALAAAVRAGVRLHNITDFEQLRSVSAFLESVWGRSAEGVPINTDVLRSVVHAGGCVTCAYTHEDVLVGAAALMPSVPSVASYSLIAAARGGGRDLGVGYAIKMDQRSWALRRTPLLVQLIFWYNLSALYPTVSLAIPFGPTLLEGNANVIITPLVAAVFGLTLNRVVVWLMLSSMRHLVQQVLLQRGRGSPEPPAAAAKATGSATASC